MTMTSTRSIGAELTIFTEITALANRTGAINLGQGFPDQDGPPTKVGRSLVRFAFCKRNIVIENAVARLAQLASQTSRTTASIGGNDDE